MGLLRLLPLLLLALQAFGPRVWAAADANPVLAGGSGSTSRQPGPSFDRPVANMPEALRPDFYAGRALAEQPWIKAPTATDARDGLGPIYNARACLACHIRGGRSRVPDNSGEALFVGPLVKLSRAGANANTIDPHDGVLADPVYGEQLQVRSVALLHQLGKATPTAIAASGDVAPEAEVRLFWDEQTFQYPDGQQVVLRKPRLQVTEAAYGDFHPDTRFSLRNAPPIHGAGLLELIPEADIAANADPDDRNGDGISGRLNQVWDPRDQAMRSGRFGLKANRANVDSIVASAFANDIGISNPLFPNQPCSSAQTRCNQQADGNNEDGFELPADLLLLVANFSRQLGVPRRDPQQVADTASAAPLFEQTGCSQCHQPRWQTAASSEFPHLGNQTIWPYTDLLLHDMGDGLADERQEFLASGREWRTPPLWGAGSGLKVNGSGLFLHDGRARSVEEAILWHDGEARAARQRFIALPQPQRQALTAFVDSL
ncbi:di-heme oxidoredictase family protein [Parathalassolituus penaei]|uniref:Thiol oxidoreductase n=1 Tax=Parathalassolituus penaei TaxID=2997323 RepID=A0A9X3ECU6_9GAMM|nr:di-heme oxidoredictase family protein [Parathalassolituus penaei]MCY0964300.1 thiol oxidoreductase [Parathalassolituus penaei]